MSHENNPANGQDHTRLLPRLDEKLVKKIDRYDVIKPLGEGGMGTVYLGHDPDLDRNVAIKMLRTELLDSEIYLTHMLREAKLCARLNHPNIVQIYQVGRYADSPYLVMEFVEGKSLHELLRTPPPMSVSVAIDIICQCCLGLGHAAKKKIVHRDIKPANIMVTPEGVAKVMDFGLSKSVAGDSRTMTSAILGTPDYMSPEQAQGGEVDFRTDIYALGITLFQCCTGYLPFRASTPMETLMNHRQMELPDDPRLRAFAKGKLHDLIWWMTAKDPVDRPNSYDQVRKELIALQGSLGAEEGTVALFQVENATPHVATTPGPPKPEKQKQRASSSSGRVPRAPGQKRKSSSLPGILITVAALGGIVFAAWYIQDQSSAPAPATLSAIPAVEPPRSVLPQETSGANPPTNLVIRSQRAGGGNLEGLMISIQSHGLNLSLGSDIQPGRYSAIYHFDGIPPSEILKIVCLGANWSAREENGVWTLGYEGRPDPDKIRERRLNTTVEFPRVNLNNISGRATLHEAFQGFRTTGGLSFLIMPESLGNARIPPLGVTNLPLNVVLDRINQQDDMTPFEWIYKDNILLAIPIRTN